jgi:hypothetical protein
MNSALSNLFFKQATCPSSETLLAYGAQRLAAQQGAHVEEHLSVCEFCDAELRLLAEYCPAEPEEYRTTSIPRDLLCLAEAILKHSSLSIESLVSAAYEKEGLTLTDA